MEDMMSSEERKQQIQGAAVRWAPHDGPGTTDMSRTDFVAGALWADRHPVPTVITRSELFRAMAGAGQTDITTVERLVQSLGIDVKD